MKVYYGRTLAEALQGVQHDLGSEAVILHTRSFRQGGFLGWFSRTVHEVTAARGSEIGRASRKRATERSGARREQEAGREPSPGQTGVVAGRKGLVVDDGDARDRPKRRPIGVETASRSSRASEMPTGDLIRKTYHAARQEMSRSNEHKDRTVSAPDGERLRASGGTAGEAGSGDSAVFQRKPASGPGDRCRISDTVQPEPEQSLRRPKESHEGTQSQIEAARIAEELSVVRRMVARLVEQQSDRRTAGSPPTADPSLELAPTDLPDALADQMLTLIRREVSQELAREIVANVRSSLSREALDDPEQVRQAVFGQIAGMIPTAEHEDSAGGLPDRLPEERPCIMALVGPTGVGKTTTVAKLAATYRLRRRRSVGLITMDTYRIGAVEQLRTYANIIGVRLEVASTPEQMSQALEKMQGLDVVLIDTAGRSQRDDPRLDQLQSMLEAAKPDLVHLVLSSTSGQSVMLEASERFGRLGIDRLIFTKLDEAVGLGVLLNVARRVNKQLSFITTGQEVPHQIEVGQAHRLARLVIDGLEAGNRSGGTRDERLPEQPQPGDESASVSTVTASDVVEDAVKAVSAARANPRDATNAPRLADRPSPAGQADDDKLRQGRASSREDQPAEGRSTATPRPANQTLWMTA